MILIVSHDQDPHAQRVIRHLTASGEKVLLFNLADLPDRASLFDRVRSERATTDRFRAFAQLVVPTASR